MQKQQEASILFFFLADAVANASMVGVAIAFQLGTGNKEEEDGDEEG